MAWKATLVNLSAIEVDLVADDDERKVDGVAWPGLYAEQVVPVLQLSERVVRRHIVHEHAAVGATTVADAQTVKPLLARRVPQLHRNITNALDLHRLKTRNVVRDLAITGQCRLKV